MIYLLVSISIMINVVLGWYGYKLLQKALLYADNIVFLHEDADDFLAHIEAVYEMETFYGDETLRALVLHSREFRDQIEEFKQNSVLEIEDEDTEELIIYGNTKTEEG